MPFRQQWQQPARLQAHLEGLPPIAPSSGHRKPAGAGPVLSLLRTLLGRDPRIKLQFLHAIVHLDAPLCHRQVIHARHPRRGAVILPRRRLPIRREMPVGPTVRLAQQPGIQLRCGQPRDLRCGLTAPAPEPPHSAVRHDQLDVPGIEQGPCIGQPSRLRHNQVTGPQVDAAEKAHGKVAIQGDGALQLLAQGPSQRRSQHGPPLPLEHAQPRNQRQHGHAHPGGDTAMPAGRLCRRRVKRPRFSGNTGIAVKGGRAKVHGERARQEAGGSSPGQAVCRPARHAVSLTAIPVTSSADKHTPDAAGCFLPGGIRVSTARYGPCLVRRHSATSTPAPDGTPS